MNQLYSVDRTAQAVVAPSYDRWLLISALSLLALGLLMVTSASMVISMRQYGQAFHYLLRQAIFVGMGLVAAAVIVRISTETWERFSAHLLFLGLFLLVLVLIPGVGREVNGSMRWVKLGPFGAQVSELAKLFFIIYMARYLVRQNVAIRTSMQGFLKPLLIVGLAVGLLLLEPDFGAAVVIISIVLGMLFLGGVRLRYFLVIVLSALGGLAFLAVSAPYRLKRVTSFLNPWAHQFDSGYQLTQSLIAFGQGGWFGVGLGESMQKLFYLPEAHTDFLLAVIGEELGLLGILLLVLCYMVLIGRAFRIGRMACVKDAFFRGYLAYGLALWLAIQTMINVGVNIGVFPTKGLTLPLLSYGGSSIVVYCMVLGLLLRVDYENKL